MNTHTKEFEVAREAFRKFNRDKPHSHRWVPLYRKTEKWVERGIKCTVCGDESVMVEIL